ncbi:hypothetical protein ACFL2D_02460 [Patescibacteria group bacterium]
MDRKEIDQLAKTISRYYMQRLPELGFGSFHFPHRLYWWTRDEKYLKLLSKKEARKFYGVPRNKKEIKIFYDHQDSDAHQRKMYMKYRGEAWKKYSDLMHMTNGLFAGLYAETLYGVDIRENIANAFSERKLLLMKQRLLQDKKSIAMLSTHAANFLYLVERYYQKNEKGYPLGNFQRYNPYYEGDDIQLEYLKIYLLTHCIIGETQFYSRKIPKDKLLYYRRMVFHAERMIRKQIYNMPLDVKLEFLVCSKLCGIKSKLEPLILSEALKSTTADGGYIVDSVNACNKRRLNDFIQSEHRNVLFLLVVTKSPMYG